MEICGGAQCLTAHRERWSPCHLDEPECATSSRNSNALHSENDVHHSFHYFWRYLQEQSQNDHKHSMALIHLKAQTSVITLFY